MTHRFVRVSLCLALVGPVFGASREAHAQDNAGVMDEDEGKPEESSEDGGWEGENEAAESSGIHFGLRLGFGLPLGDAVSGQKLNDSTVGQIPIWLDLGWQATPSLMVGGYFAYGFAILGGNLKDTCDSGNLRCKLGDMRAGAQVQLSFAPGRSVDPWLGLGLGYEWLHLSTRQGSETLHGFELPMLQGGLDFPSVGQTYVGPFVALSLATFRKESVDQGGNSQSLDVPDKAMHEWLFVGVRGVLH